MHINGPSLPTHGRRVVKTVVAVGLAALIVVGVAAAAVMRGGAHGSAAASDTFVLANAVKIDTLDPAQNSVNETIWLNQNIYSRLLQPNATARGFSRTSQPREVSNGGKTYTFMLRPAQFSDGCPVTAQDAAFSILRAKNTEGGWGFLLTA